MAKTTETLTPTEQLARWLHKTFALHDRSARPEERLAPTFAKLSERTRDNYRAVAARLLTDPPACLREARS